MKFAIIPASLVNAAPFARMDAGYWVRAAQRAARLGELVEQAQQNAEEELQP